MGAEHSTQKKAQKAFDIDQLACCGAKRTITEAKADRRGLPSAPRQSFLASTQAAIAAQQSPRTDASALPQMHFPSHPAYVGPPQERRAAPAAPSRQVATGRETKKASQVPSTDANPPNELIKALTELKNAKSASLRESAPQEKVRAWLSKHESGKSLPQDEQFNAHHGNSSQGTESMGLRNQSNQGFDDPDIVSRPSKAPVGAVGSVGRNMGRVDSAAFNMGKVPNATFNMKHSASAPAAAFERVGSSDSRRLPPSDGAWFPDPEAGSDGKASKAETEGYNDPELVSKPAKAPVGRVSSSKSSQAKEASIGRTGYNSLKVAVAHLKDARQNYNNPERAGLKNPYARASSLNHIKSPPAGFDDPDIISRPPNRPVGSFGGRARMY